VIPSVFEGINPVNSALFKTRHNNRYVELGIRVISEFPPTALEFFPNGSRARKVCRTAGKGNSRRAICKSSAEFVRGVLACPLLPARHRIPCSAQAESANAIRRGPWPIVPPSSARAEPTPPESPRLAQFASFHQQAVGRYQSGPKSARFTEQFIITDVWNPARFVTSRPQPARQATQAGVAQKLRYGRRIVRHRCRMCMAFQALFPALHLGLQPVADTSQGLGMRYPFGHLQPLRPREQTTDALLRLAGVDLPEQRAEFRFVTPLDSSQARELRPPAR